jgi:hypothetical protein
VSLLGTHLTVLLGPTVPVPAPPELVLAMKSAEVRYSDSEDTGWEIVFQAGRSGPTDLVDYPALILPLLRPGNRVIMVVTVGPIPQVILDGIVTEQELTPGTRAGTATITIRGKDVSVLMSLHEVSTEWVGMPEGVIARLVILSYFQVQLLPFVVDPPLIDPPLPIDRVPTQQKTDLEFLRDLAGSFGYVFYVTPGPAPGLNTGYWGPPVRVGMPQKALTVNMGAESNATIGAFRHEATRPTMVSGSVQDPLLGDLPVQTFAPLRPPLASEPTWLVNQDVVRRKQLRESGVTAVEAFAYAQGITDETSDSVFVDGELDTARYEAVLQPRSLVGLRGVGYSYDGLYYVKSVTHTIERGRYHQRFALTREGIGSTTPAVIP